MCNTKLIKTPIQDLYVLEKKIYYDERGCFYEAFNKRELEKLGINCNFVQDNQSINNEGVLRGVHIQKNFPQGKLVRCDFGAIFDVAVDLRKNSTTFGKWFGIELSDKNHKQLYIPEGFAHGFYVVKGPAIVSFKVTDYWHPNNEIGFNWDDKEIDIKWPIKDINKVIIAKKDSNLLTFSEVKDILINRI